MSRIYYHYCKLETFYKIINSNSMWLCNVYKMNDREENEWIETVVRDKIENYLKENKNKNKIYLDNFYQQYLDVKKRFNPYATCFSKESDMLSQWRGYADDGKGIAVGVDFGKLKVSHSDEFDIWKDNHKTRFYNSIEYNLQKQKEVIKTSIEEYMKGCISNKQETEMDSLIKLIKKIIILSIFFKKEGFKEESEVRIACLDEAYSYKNKKFTCRNSEIISYIELDLPINSEVIPEIVLGPKCKVKEDDNDFNQYLRSVGLGQTKLIRSEISYI